MMKIGAAFAGALVGFYLPDLFVSNMIARRQHRSCAPFPTRWTCC